MDYIGHMLIMLDWGVRFMEGTTTSVKLFRKANFPQSLCSQKTPPLNDHSETNKSCLGLSLEVPKKGGAVRVVMLIPICYNFWSGFS